MWNIAINTFKEIVRNKFLYLILFFAFVFIIFSLLLGRLTLWDDDKMIVDFWLGMIEIFWLIGVLFVGSQLLFKEVEGKTIFLILSKPIRRWEFILGKFIGFSESIFLIVLFQGIVFLIVLLSKGILPDDLIIISIIFTFLKLEIILALVFFFSTFMSHILTITVSIMVYLVSHSFSLLIDLSRRIGSTLFIKIMQTVELLFPPLEALNIKDVIWSFKDFSFLYIFWNSLYSILYIMIILFFSVLIFNKKTFER